MPTIRIPLVGSFNQREIDGDAQLSDAHDQRFLNCIFHAVKNPITEKITLYVEKRPGWGQENVVGGSNASTGLINPLSFNATLTAFGDTNSTIYLGQTSVGTITGRALYFKETLIGSTGHVMIRSSDGTGWYFPSGAEDQTSYTGDTHTNTVIDGIASTTGMYIGQKLSGTGIVAGTRIATITSGTAITVDTATTATNAGVTITKEPIAKIIDTDFSTSGTYISGFEEMNGYIFYITETGNLYNSDLNSVTAWTASNYIAANMSPDPGVAIARQKDKIIVLGTSSKQVFYDAGNATGSPLGSVPQFYDKIGTLSQRSVTTLENDIYFCSSPRWGELGIWRIKDLQATKVSTPAIDRILGTTTSTGGAVYANSFRLGGYSYAAFFLSNAADGPASNLLLETTDALLLESGDNILLEDAPGELAAFARLLVYNVELELWSEWDSTKATFIDGGAAGSANRIYATSRVETDGKVYSIDPLAQDTLFRDDGDSYTMEIRTTKLDLGTSKRKRIHSIRLICDDDSTGTAYLSWSDDDYVTWSTPRAFDLTSREPKLVACGSHKGGRAYKLTHASNSNFRAQAIEIEFESEADKIRTRTTE